MDNILEDLGDMADDLIDGFMETIYDSVDFNNISSSNFGKMVTAMDHMPMEYIENIPASVVSLLKKLSNLSISESTSIVTVEWHWAESELKTTTSGPQGTSAFSRTMLSHGYMHL